MKKIPFNKPLILGNEPEYLKKVISKNKFSGKGEFSSKCEELLVNITGCTKAIMTSSGTSAMEIVAGLCDFQSGDEVIMPSFTHIGTANPFVNNNAGIVWCDIRPDTKNIDETKIEALITTKTKAIVAVHYAGIPCEMNLIKKICIKHNFLLIEDAAQALGSRYNNKSLGSFGDFAVLSFHETKNIHCGEGGAVLINNPNFIEDAEILSNRGTDRKDFCKGLVGKYQWIRSSSNFSLSELQSAFLYSQLLAINKILEKRIEIWEKYYSLFSEILPKDKLPIVLPISKHNGHLFYILTNDEAQRKKLISYLAGLGIQAVFHYSPLHTSPARESFATVDLPITDEISKTILRFPMFYDLTKEQIEYIAATTKRFFKDEI